MFRTPRFSAPVELLNVKVNVCAGPLPKLGIAEIGADPDTTKSTAEPGFTNVPAVGFSLITLPPGTVLLDAAVTVPTTNPALVIAVVAAAFVMPTTFGTATCG
jgi:hypothetical protein